MTPAGRNVLTILALSVIAGIVWIGFILDSGMRATSLNGISLSYRDLGLQFLGLPSGEANYKGSCYDRDLLTAFDNPNVADICTSIANWPAKDACGPVNADEIVPPSVNWFSDTLVVNMLVANADTEKLRSYLLNYSEEQLHQIAPLTNGRDRLVTGLKSIEGKQCGPDAFVRVTQHYYNFRK